MKITTLATITAISLGAAASSQAALTLLNGDFENPVGGADGVEDFDNWTESGQIERNNLSGNSRAKLVGSAGASLLSDSAGTILAGDVGATIDLSFEFYDPHTGTNPSNLALTVDLLFDGVAAETQTLARTSIEGNGTLTGSSLSTYTVLAGDVGKAVTVRITGTSDGGPGWAQTGVDNVALTLTPVPEPSSAALLGLGGLALILRRRK